MQAIIRIGSSQFLVSPGSQISALKPQIDEVLAIYDEAQPQPAVALSGLTPAQIKVENTGETRGPKIRVFKFKAKSRYRKTRGHHSRLFNLKIVDIQSSVKTS